MVQSSWSYTNSLLPGCLKAPKIYVSVLQQYWGKNSDRFVFCTVDLLDWKLLLAIVTRLGQQ